MHDTWLPKGGLPPAASAALCEGRRGAGGAAAPAPLAWLPGPAAPREVRAQACVLGRVFSGWILPLILAFRDYPASICLNNLRASDLGFVASAVQELQKHLSCPPHVPYVVCVHGTIVIISQELLMLQSQTKNHTDKRYM